MELKEQLIKKLKNEGYSEIYEFSFLNEFSDAFNDYLKKIKVVKYLILGENPLSWQTYVNNAYGIGGYINPINDAFCFEGKPEKRLDFWAEKGILFVDIYQMFNTETKEGINLGNYRETLMKSKINFKREKLNYPVFRLKIAISHIEEKLKVNNIKVTNDFKVALMMPQLTSLPIFNYFSNPKNKISLRDIDFSSFLRQINNDPNYLGTMENIIIP